MNRLRELLEWLDSIPPDFAFLLSLPFLVAAAGLLADQARGRLSRKLPGKEAPEAFGHAAAGAGRVRVSPSPPPGSS